MSDIVNIGVEHIHPHPENPRKDLGDLTELVESIKKNGVMQNLTVIPQEGSHGEYIAIIGHRRHAAAKLAGIAELPCRIIEGMSKKEQVSTMLEENMQRNDLTVYEQAQGFQMMLDLGETEDSIAEKTGFSKTTIRHRLNIAKLDQKELKKKENDGSFQLTLKDLYELEKVEDIRTRNKILKDARDSREIASMAQREAAEALRNKHLKAIEAMMKKMGIEKAPKEAENEMWTGKWEKVKEIDLDMEVPGKIMLKEKGTLYYLRYYRSVRIIRKIRKEKKELTPEEIKQKQRDRNKKEIRERIKEMNACRKEFIQNIFSGKIDAVKNDDEIREKVWRFLMERGVSISPSSMRSFFTGKHDYDCSDEERTEAKKKVDSLSFTHSMLLVMHYTAENIGDIFDWQGCYKPDIGKKLASVYNVLKPYGWTFASEDDEKLLEGTHELYWKEDEKDG